MNNMGKPASPLAGGILLDAGTALDDTYWEFLGTKGTKRYYHYIDGQWTEIDEDTTNDEPPVCRTPGRDDPPPA